MLAQGRVANVIWSVRPPERARSAAFVGTQQQRTLPEFLRNLDLALSRDPLPVVSGVARGQVEEAGVIVAATSGLRAR